MEVDGGSGCEWVVGKSTEMRLGLTGGSWKNEGIGSLGRVEGCFERQNWKEDLITREIRSLKVLAILSVAL